MKVSYNWLKEYLDFDLSTDELSYWLTTLGLEVEGVESFESIKGGLLGIVTGHVLTCDQHPNADRLSVTTVDIGQDAPAHIVCGAPNVAAGQKVLVATVGTELYAEDGEAWKIKKSKIRGELSEGMICAEDELGLGESHDGIMVLPDDTLVGQPAASIFNVELDTVYEIGLTPNRSDGTSQLGSARDLAAGLGFHAGQKMEIKYPEVKRETDGPAHDFTVEIKNTHACPRYAGLIIENITIGQSPDWMQNRLSAIGVRPINSVVDITNFVLHEYGQPLHAFDFDKIKGGGIVVDTLPAGTKFLSLDEMERELHEDDLMICDAERNPMCIGGVFGGLNSGVTETTTRIFLESAHFDPEFIRRTSMRHNLRTDAAKVFEKGSDPNIADEALWRAANLIKDICGATIAEPVFDHYPNMISKKSILVRRDKVNGLIGVDLSHDAILKIFNHLNFIVEEESNGAYQILIPTDKSDVLREVDVIEEILRIYGYDHVPVSAKLKTSIVHADNSAPHTVRNKLIDRFTSRGFHQMMNLSLSRSAYYENRNDLVGVLNTSNSHLDIMRPDMIISALESASYNIKHQNRDFRLFEFGHTYQKVEDEYIETEKLSFITSGNQSADHWNAKSIAADYYAIKSIVEKAFPAQALSKLVFEDSDIDGAAYCQQIKLNNKQIGYIAQVSPSLCDKFDIEQDVYYGEIDFAACQKLWSKGDVTFQTISKFPGSQRDIALIVNESVVFQQISDVVNKSKLKKLTQFDLFDVYRNDDHVGKGKKSMGIRLDFIDDQKTLQDKEVDKMVSKLMSALQRELGAELR